MDDVDLYLFWWMKASIYKTILYINTDKLAYEFCV